MEFSKPLTKRILEWMSANPQGACADEIAPILGVEDLQATKSITRLKRDGKVKAHPDPKGIAAHRLRYFAPEHFPAHAPAALKTAKPKPHKAVKLDATAPVVCNIKVTKCPGFTGESPFRPKTAPAIFSGKIWQFDEGQSAVSRSYGG